METTAEMQAVDPAMIQTMHDDERAAYGRRLSLPAAPVFRVPQGPCREILPCCIQMGGKAIFVVLLEA